MLARNANRGMVVFDPAMVKTMERLLTGRTDEALNAQFGISYNTWRKLVAGSPIRASLGARLVQRIATIASDYNEVMADSVGR